MENIRGIQVLKLKENWDENNMKKDLLNVKAMIAKFVS